MKEAVKTVLKKAVNPRIIIESDSIVTIENHRGVKLLTENEVKILSNIGIINISGEDMEVEYIGNYTLIVKGKIKSIKYEGKRL